MKALEKVKQVEPVSFSVWEWLGFGGTARRNNNG